MNNNLVTIGTIATAPKLSRQRLYYYEKLDLISPTKIINGRKYYDKTETLEKVLRIKRFQSKYKFSYIKEKLYGDDVAKGGRKVVDNVEGWIEGRNGTAWPILSKKTLKEAEPFYEIHKSITRLLFSLDNQTISDIPERGYFNQERTRYWLGKVVQEVYRFMEAENKNEIKKIEKTEKK